MRDTNGVKCRHTVPLHKCSDLLVRDSIWIRISRPEIRRSVLLMRFQVEDALHAVNTYTEKILFSTTGKDSPEEPRAIGVQVSQTREGKKWRVKARKEVIVSCGTSFVSLHRDKLMLIELTPNDHRCDCDPTTPPALRPWPFFASLVPLPINSCTQRLSASGLKLLRSHLCWPTECQSKTGIHI